MEFQALIYQKAQDVATLILNRPEVLNALNAQLREELMEALKQAELDPEVRFIVIRGAGRAFCAGADIKEFESEIARASPQQRIREIKQRGMRLRIYELIRSLSKPVIALVHGHCNGGGFELALSCDLIIASQDAQFGFGEARIGLIPGGGGTQLLPRLIGIKKAAELIFTGERISAEEAYRLGILNKLVPREELDRELDSLLNKLRACSSFSIKMAKSAIWKTLELGLSAGLDYEREAFLSCMLSQDFQEGARAFLEKRRPVFKGA